ncbi:MAG: class I SAM-dependent methyltransferase [Pseudomonadota bacterium]
MIDQSTSAPAALRERLISHAVQPQPETDDTQLLASISARLHLAGDLPDATVAQQITLLHALAELDVGRFLLRNRGLNAYWTHRVVTYRPGDAEAARMLPLERRLYETLPAVLALRERFHIFLTQLQSLLKPGLTFGSVPGGWMGDLLLLDYEAHPDVRLIGIDLDQQALDGAAALAAQRGLSERLSLRCEDAWNMTLCGELDVLVSHGLNVYEPDDARVQALYAGFFAALKPGGTLVASFLTPPPTVSEQSPWDMARIDRDALGLQMLLFIRLIDAKWSTYRTHAHTRAQLEAAGFGEIRFIDDRARMFPTVVARKPA